MIKLFNFLLFECVELDVVCWILLGMDKFWNMLLFWYIIMYNFELFFKKIIMDK